MRGGRGLVVKGGDERCTVVGGYSGSSTIDVGHVGHVNQTLP